MYIQQALLALLSLLALQSHLALLSLLALPSLLVLPSLLQGSNSRTGTRICGERMRHRIAAETEQGGQSGKQHDSTTSVMNRVRVHFITLQLYSSSGL